MFRTVKLPFLALSLFVLFFGTTGTGQEGNNAARRTFVAYHLRKNEGLAGLMHRHHCSITQLAQVMDDNGLVEDQLLRLPRTRTIRIFAGCANRGSDGVAARSVKILADQNTQFALLRQRNHPPSPKALSSNAQQTSRANPIAPSALPKPAMRKAAGSDSRGWVTRLLSGKPLAFFDGTVLGVLVILATLLFMSWRRSLQNLRGVWVNCAGKKKYFPLFHEPVYSCSCGEKMLKEKNLARHWKESSLHTSDWITTGPRESFLVRWIPWLSPQKSS
jgi:hypothetical protein